MTQITQIERLPGPQMTQMTQIERLPGPQMTQMTQIKFFCVVCLRALNKLRSEKRVPKAPQQNAP